jgi:Ca2+-binding EF-hand superfamily protein
MADPQQAAELFTRLDANGDKLLASDEAPEGLANLIRRADRDGDGKLSQNEFQAAARRMSAGNNGSPPDSAAGRGNMRQLLTRWDRNGDGALSRAEAPPRMARTFDQLDQDGNGSLSARELQQFRPGRARPQRPVTDAQPVEMDEEMQQ